LLRNRPFHVGSLAETLSMIGWTSTQYNCQKCRGRPK
jgi:hypothetical protein